MQLSENQVDRTIGVLLRVGVVVAAIIVLAGGVWYYLSTGDSQRNYRVFRGVPPELASPTAVFHAAVAGNAAALIQLGLLILIATPVARVAYSAAAFALQRDRIYTLITLIVLAVLMYGLW